MKFTRFFILAACLFFGLTGNSLSEPYDRILVTIGGDLVITQNELDLAIFELQQDKQIAASQGGSKEFMRQQTLSRMIDERLLDTRADEMEIKVSDDELDEEITRFQRNRKLTESAFEELLLSQNFSLFSFRELYHKRLRRDKVIVREIRSQIRISDEELKNLYEKDSNQASVRARHILRLVPPNASPEEVKKAHEEIIWVTEKIKSGSSFSKMADEYSQDPSVKSNHGDLGFFQRQDMVSEFAEEAYRLQIGELSKPVRTEYGVHLIEVLEKKQLPKPPFEKVKDKIYSKYYQQIFQEKLEAYLADLRKKAKVVFRKKQEKDR